MEIRPAYSSNPVKTGSSAAPNLGLVCISSTDEVRFRTITRTRYLNLDPAQRYASLKDLYSDNIRRLDKALSFCHARHIRLYRISSALFPMSDLEGDETGALALEELAPRMAEIGRKATHLDIRVVMHPDQFVVLSSESPRIVAASVKVLERHALTLDMFGFPRSTWTAMTIHGGKGGRADQMVKAIADLPFNVRSRLTLENDEHAYGAEEILDICRRAGVPMVFDIHHHICHYKLSHHEDEAIKVLIAAARATWPVPEWQLVHLSSGRDGFNDPAHHDFILSVPSAYLTVPWIEVEAKAKEQAIERLRAEWPAAGQLETRNQKLPTF